MGGGRLSPSDRTTEQPPNAQDYLAVLQTADLAVDALGRLEERASGSEARDWARRRRLAGEAEGASLSAASATGRLTEYEAAVRALVGERIPLDDAPPALGELARAAAEELERLAMQFRRTLSPDLPAPGTQSMALRAAGRAHGSRSFAPVSTLRVDRAFQRAAASSPAEPASAEWTSETGSRRLSAQLGERHLELWVVDADETGPPLAPLALRDGDASQLLFALFAAGVVPDGRLGYLRVPYEHDRVVVELGEPLRFDELRPRDAPAILASISASARSWRDLWSTAAPEVSWLSVLAARQPVEHERD